jgi:hypothetical protein
MLLARPATAIFVSDCTSQVQRLLHNGEKQHPGTKRKLGDNPVPAAIAGILNDPPVSDDNASVASVIIYLEPWASAQTGKVVKLTDFTLSLFRDKQST